MKTLLTLGFLLPAMILFPGCYTILLIEPTDEDVSFNPDPIPPYDPGPDPPYPPPPHLPSAGDRRPIQTGRGPLVSNPAPTRNDENNRQTRDSGVQRNGQRDSNPVLARTDDTNREIRDSGIQRGRR